MKLKLMVLNKKEKTYEEKVYSQSFVPFKYKRKTLDLFTKSEKGEIDQMELMDLQNELLVDMFCKQFTVTDIENGLDMKTVGEQLYNIFYHEILEYPSYAYQMKQVEEIQADFLEKAQKSAE